MLNNPYEGKIEFNPINKIETYNIQNKGNLNSNNNQIFENIINSNNSIYNTDMSSPSNYFSIIHDANLNLKLENERLKKELIEKNKIISQFENMAGEANNKLEQLDNMIKQRVNILYAQIEEIGKIFNISLDCDFIQKIKEYLRYFQRFEQENFNLKKEIQNLQRENHKLKQKYCDLENQICHFKKREYEYNNKEKEYLDNIYELKNNLYNRESDINSFKNKLFGLKNRINKIECKNEEYISGKEIQNIMNTE